jgi:hypothetical protein
MLIKSVVFILRVISQCSAAKCCILLYGCAGPSGHTVQGVGLRPLACCDRGFESHPEHGCLSVVCVVRYRSLRRADHSSRGVLPTVARRCVRSRNLVNVEAIARAGLQSQR